MSLFEGPLIQVILGLAFLYFVFALATMAINEGIAQKLGLRAAMLEKAISNLLGHDGLTEAVYSHHLVNGMTSDVEDPQSKPSYLPGDVFATALTDVLGLSGDGFSALAVKKALAKRAFKGAHTQALVALANESGTDLTAFRAKVASWFDASMDRATGWYKRSLKTISFYVSLALVFAFNADTITVSGALWQQPAALSAQARAVGSQASMPTPGVNFLQDARLQNLIGWHASPKPGEIDLDPGDPLRQPRTAAGWALKLTGLLATVLLVSLGAPFWFDFLNRMNSVSSSGVKPAKSGGDKP